MNPIAPDFKLADDGFVHLCPLGEFQRDIKDPVSGKVRTIVQVVDAPAVEAMAKDINAHAGNVLIDRDHNANRYDGDSRAFGWILEAQARPDGLYGKPRWTKHGLDAVTGGEYRYISPTWRPGIELEKIGEDRYRATKFWRASVTNDAWFVEHGPGMHPITYRDTEPIQEEPNMDPKILELLGLAPEATVDDAVAAIQALLDAKAKAETATVEARATAQKKTKDSNEPLEFRAILEAVPEEKRDQVRKELEQLKGNGSAELQAEKDMLEFRAVIDTMTDDQKAAIRDGLIQNRAGTRAGLVLAARAADPVDPRKGGVPFRSAADGKPVAGPVDAETAGKEFDASKDLQKEFDCREDYIAFRAHH